RPSVAASMKLKESESASREYIRDDTAIGDLPTASVVIKDNGPRRVGRRFPEIALKPQAARAEPLTVRVGHATSSFATRTMSSTWGTTVFSRCCAYGIGVSRPARR